MQKGTKMNLTEMFKGKDDASGTAPRKATDLLKEDHQKVKGLFKAFRGLEEDEDQEKGRLFEEIRRELTLHAKVEEEIFYPAVKKIPEAEARRLVLEAGEEHAIVKMLLGQLESLDPGDDVFGAKMKVLMEGVEHHADEEESDMFPEARKGLDDDELVELGRRIELRKNALLGSETRPAREPRRSAASAPRRSRPARPAVKAASAKKSSTRGARRRPRKS
jgi:hemerythrin superfamily protein